MSIKSDLVKVAQDIFWEQFLQISKKWNKYSVSILMNWDPIIVNNIKYWNFNWSNEEYNLNKWNYEKFHVKWEKFEIIARKINPEFSKWFDDSDRWFVPNNYLFYDFK